MASRGMGAVVVGGGVGGLAAALALTHAGMDVMVLEAETEPQGPPIGLVLWPNAMQALSILGVSERVQERGAPLEAQVIQTWDGKVLSRAGFSAKRHLGVAGACIREPDLLEVLRAELRDDVVYLGQRVVGLEATPQAATAVLESGHRVEGDVLVGADGIHSVVRRSLITDRPRHLGSVAWRGLAALSVPGGVAVGRRAHFSWHPVGGNQTHWLGTRHGGPDPHIRDSRSELLDRFGRWWHPIPALIQATGSREIRREELYDRPPAWGWGDGLVTLLGDAAHPMAPAVGQGAGLALEDAVMLGAALAHHASPADPARTVRALRLYEANRIPRAASMQRAAFSTLRLLQPRTWAGHVRRDAVLRLPTQWLARRQAWMFDFRPVPRAMLR